MMSPQSTWQPDQDRMHWRPIRQLLLLVLLWIVVFRVELKSWLDAALSQSEWSHAIALPLVGAIWCYLRRNDLRAIERAPSRWGPIVITLGAMTWLATHAFGLFSYLSLAAAIITAVGCALAALGRPLVRRLAPLLLITLCCLPLFERTLDRVTISIQRLTLESAAAVLDSLPSLSCETQVLAISMRTPDLQSLTGPGEQRFGARLLPCSAMIGCFITFDRKRSFATILVAMLSAIPILLLVNLLRVLAWCMTVLYARSTVFDQSPRVVSIATSIVAAHLLFSVVTALSDRLVRWFDHDNATAGHPPIGVDEAGEQP